MSKKKLSFFLYKTDETFVKDQSYKKTSCFIYKFLVETTGEYKLK